MPFKEGNKHGQGRPAGKPNRITAEIREVLSSFVVENAQNLTTWLEQIEKPEDKINAFSKLLPFVVPKVNEVHLTNELRIENQQPDYDFSQLPIELHDEFDRVQDRYGVLVAMCEKKRV